MKPYEQGPYRYGNWQLVDAKPVPVEDNEPWDLVGLGYNSFHGWIYLGQGKDIKCLLDKVVSSLAPVSTEVYEMNWGKY